MLRSLATKPKSRHPIFTTIYPQITPQDPTLYTLTPECLPSHPISTTSHPQITPTGLVFWQGRVKVRSGLTLPNTHKYWQPLRVGLSKTSDVWRRMNEIPTKKSKKKPISSRIIDIVGHNCLSLSELFPVLNHSHRLRKKKFLTYNNESPNFKRQ